MIKIANKTVYIQKYIYYITLLLFVMTTVAGWFGITAERTKIKVDPIKCEQEITGWGTSACWWAQKLGEEEHAEAAEEIVKLLYSKEGLGLNIYRYNIGGGSKDDPTGRLDKNSSRATESFLVYDDEAGEYVYDWSKDAAAQNILDMALEYGCIDTVILFANSPHYSMCVSGNASGGFEPAVSNLKKECYQDFVDYFLDITEYFLEKGVPVKYISPINEPQWDWGGEWVGQEGCHYEIDEAIELYKLFALEIKERNLDVKLSGLESGQVGEHAMECIEKLYADEDIKSVMGTYAYHSYWTDNNFGAKKAFGTFLKYNYPCVEVEMSEWCELPNAHLADDIEAGLIMARTIGEDISLTGANAWSAWVAVNEGGERADSMIYVGDSYSDYGVSKRYPAMAHYTKFIPVGSRVIDCDMSIGDVTVVKEWWKQTIGDKEYPVYTATNKTTTSAYVTPEGEIVVVIVNQGDAKKVAFNQPLMNMEVYTTDAERDLELTYEGRYYKALEVPAKSITTVVFSAF